MSGEARDEDDPIGTFAGFGEFDVDAAHAADIVALGIDSGATLAKLCARDASGGLRFATWASPATDRLVELVRHLEPDHLGVTGCGSAALAPRLGRAAACPIEFDAWARGADEMLERHGYAPVRPYLLVAIGTGTSALRVDGDRVERMGGTALGGGAALGLGYALTGARTPEALNALALEGQRHNIDLMVTDLFEDASDVGAVIASSFGKLARHLSGEAEPRPDEADLAAAALGIVSDNIGLLVTAYARAANVERVVYGGSTLLVHPQFADVARAFGAISGHETIVLPRGGHAGALGACLIGMD